MFSLGQRIREVRLKKGLTQVELAEGLCTPSMISQIESDRARPSFKVLFAIAEKLDVPTEKLLMDAELNLDVVSAVKVARAMVMAKDYAAAIPMLRELVEEPKAQGSAMELLLDLGECFVQTEEYVEAERTLQQAQEFAILRSDVRVQTLVLKHLGQLEFGRKRYPLAQYFWSKALQQTEKMTGLDVYLKAGLLYSLGLVYEKTGDQERSIEWLEESSILYESADSLNEMGRVYMGVGNSYKETNDLEKSVEYSSRAIGIFEGLDNLVMTLKHKVECAALYGQSGRETEAEELFQAAIRQFRELGKLEEAGMALVEYAAFSQQQGKLTVAVDACYQARSLLPEIHLYQAKVNRVLARVDVERENLERAVEHFEAAAKEFDRLEEIGEWGDTMHELSSLYIQRNDYKRALWIMDWVRSHTHEVMGKRGIVL